MYHTNIAMTIQTYYTCINILITRGVMNNAHRPNRLISNFELKMSLVVFILTTKMYNVVP